MTAKPVHYRHLSFGQRVLRDWKLNKWKYLLIIPVLVYLALFCYKPMYGLVIAFKNYKPTRGIERSAWMDPWYAWFEKFFTDPYFGRLIGNTFTISDGSNAIMSFTVKRGYQSGLYLISSPDLKNGTSYTVYSGSTVSGDDWHGLYTEPTVSSLGSELGSVTAQATAGGSNMGGMGGRP